jgi:hypothetical protein
MRAALDTRLALTNDLHRVSALDRHHRIQAHSSRRTLMERRAGITAEK